MFLTLTKPYRALDASTVASSMNEVIQLAGLHKHGYSAKCFRPTGATVTIPKEKDPAGVTPTGRWKTQSVFSNHYVHAKTSASYTEGILNSE